MRCTWGGLLLWLLLSTIVEARPPAIAIVLDDMGNNLALGKQALALPGKLTFAFLPHTPYAASLSAAAHATARESIVHLPMQSVNQNTLGPGGLTLDMVESEVERTLLENLSAVPFAVGVNNHMGSSLTANMQMMSYLMKILAERKTLYFLDSRTHELTVAEQAAQRAGIPTSRRDIFLDNQCDEASISQQLDLLIAKAQRHGTAVAIGHPYPETLAVLSRRLPELAERGVELISLSNVIERQSADKPAWDVQNQAIVNIGPMENIDDKRTDTPRAGL